MVMDEPFADTIALARIVIPTDALPPDQISTLLIMAMGRLQASGMVFQSFASASLPHHYPERVEGLRSRRRLCPVDGGGHWIGVRSANSSHPHESSDPSMGSNQFGLV